MTTNNPEAVAYRYTSSRSFGKRNPKWHYQESFPHAENRKVEEIGQLEKLIRLSDYEALQAECEKLRKDAELWEPIISDIHRWAGNEHAMAGRCDFTVTVAYEDCAAIDDAMQGGNQ